MDEQTATDFNDLFAAGLPPPTPPFKGLPRYNFVGGHGDPLLVPVEALAEAAQSVLRRDGANLAIYNLGHGPLGYRDLRTFIAEKLARHRGVDCGADDILVTSGSMQGIDLVNRLLINRGDTVIAEEFTYGGTLNKLARAGAKVVPLPLDDQGLRIDALEAILRDLHGKGVRAKYIYTIPTVQNPTGSILSLDRRQQLLALSRQYGVPIFEDECYADLVWTLEAPPSLFGLDPRQTIHIGSFSKTLAPALRIGYVAAAPDIISRLAACKSDGGTGAMDQMLAAEFFRQHFDAHVGRLTEALSGKLATMVEAIEREFGTAAEISRPLGGIYLWLRLPGIDVTKLVAPAAAAGISFNAGPEWSCGGPDANSCMRLCFALPSHDDIREGIAKLAQVSFEVTGTPSASANIRRAG